MAEDDTDKPYEPSQKRLDDARKRGEVPQSADLTAAAAYTGFLLASVGFGASGLFALAGTLQGMLARADTMSADWFNGGAGPQSATIAADVLLALAPWIALPAVLAVVAIIATRSFAMSTEKLAVKWSRVSLVSNAKNKFGRRGLFEFAKSFVKLLVYGVVLAVFLRRALPEILTTMSMTPALSLSYLMALCLRFIAIVCVIAVVIGLADFGFQHFDHRRRNRMSHKEMTDEHKEQEGDPYLKQKRRQKGHDIAMNRMLSDVPDASVVLVNPTHYAVALRWERANGGAPVCVAKGTDEIAARIREIAIENGIPIHRDPPTARALFASVDIGQEVFPEHYQAVATAIRFAEKMRRKARGHA